METITPCPRSRPRVLISFSLSHDTRRPWNTPRAQLITRTLCAQSRRRCCSRSTPCDAPCGTPSSASRESTPDTSTPPPAPIPSGLSAHARATTTTTRMCVVCVCVCVRLPLPLPDPCFRSAFDLCGPKVGSCRAWTWSWSGATRSSSWRRSSTALLSPAPPPRRSTPDACLRYLAHTSFSCPRSHVRVVRVMRVVCVIRPTFIVSHPTRVFLAGVCVCSQAKRNRLVEAKKAELEKEASAQASAVTKTKPRTRSPVSKGTHPHAPRVAWHPSMVHSAYDLFVAWRRRLWL
jgi:hypothetical protein